VHSLVVLLYSRLLVAVVVVSHLEQFILVVLVDRELFMFDGR
jgi:hypothetical protein